jgi:putative ABC transport system permease protein
MIKTYLVSSRIDNLGYEPRGVLQARAELLHSRYRDPEQVRLFGRQLVDRLGATPQVQMAALESERFLGTFVGRDSRVTVEGSATSVPDNVVPRFARGVTPGYFELLHIPLLRGRAITNADVGNAPAVAVLNAAAAEVLWPGQDALGKRFRIGGDTSASWLTVVGVVGDIAGAGTGRRRSAPFIYTSFFQQPTQPVTILVRTAIAPPSFVPALRSAVASVDRDQPLTDVQPMEVSAASWVSPVLFFVRVLGVLAVIALGLAAMGIYGVVSYAVSQRTHEIGVRVALGASSRRVLGQVVGHGILLGAVGAALGLAGSVLVTRVMQQILYGTSPTDPLVLGAVTLVLVGVAVLASVVPARRALAVNPVDALRSE